MEMKELLMFNNQNSYEQSNIPVFTCMSNILNHRRGVS